MEALQRNKMYSPASTVETKSSEGEKVMANSVEASYLRGGISAIAGSATNQKEKVFENVDEVIAPVVWMSEYSTSSEIETDRLYMSHPRYSSDEALLLKKLYAEFKSGGSTYTPFELDDDMEVSDIHSLLKMHNFIGGFFSRVWFIKDKSSNQLIGIIMTKELDSNGFSEIERHILSKYRSTGLGSDALMAVFDFYSQYCSKKYIHRNPNEFREGLVPIIDYFSDRFLSHDASNDFKKSWRNSVDIHEIKGKAELFPKNVSGYIMRSAFKSLSNDSKSSSIFNGLSSHPVSLGAIKSLEKCQFTKKGCKYYKTVT